MVLYISLPEIQYCLISHLFLHTTLGYIMPEKFSIDIDTQLDWDIAQFLMRREL